MKSALITGSSGFIGKNLKTKLVQAKYRVFEFSRKNHRDVTRPDNFINLPPVDLVFHLGAVSGYQECNANPTLAYKVNVGGTVNVLEYCRRVKAKLIFPSTYIYDRPYSPYKKEADFARPTTNYAFTKWLGEQLCRFYTRIYQVNTLILRTANVYGQGQSEIYLIPLLAHSLKINSTIDLTKPNIERSFIYIDDLIEAYFRLAQAKTKPGETFNVSYKVATTIKDLIAQIETVTGKKIKVVYSGRGRKNEINLNRINISKLKAKLSWEPQFSLNQGLKELHRSHYL